MSFIGFCARDVCQLPFPKGWGPKGLRIIIVAHSVCHVDAKNAQELCMCAAGRHHAHPLHRNCACVLQVAIMPTLESSGVQVIAVGLGNANNAQLPGSAQPSAWPQSGLHAAPCEQLCGLQRPSAPGLEIGFNVPLHIPNAKAHAIQACTQDPK
eukprot:1137820-Pelagomonas_calceolata.AAC.5